MASSGRFYFSIDGVQFPHDLQGSTFEGCGQFVDMTAANKRNATPFDRRRTNITIFTGGKNKTRTITCNDFQGRPVRVKLWFPNNDARDCFDLVPEVGPNIVSCAYCKEDVIEGEPCAYCGKSPVK